MIDPDGILYWEGPDGPPAHPRDVQVWRVVLPETAFELNIVRLPLVEGHERFIVSIVLNRVLTCMPDRYENTLANSKKTAKDMLRDLAAQLDKLSLSVSNRPKPEEEKQP